MNLVVVLVRFREPLLGPEEIVEAILGAEFEGCIHLDRVEGADLYADLAAHADGDINLELRGVELGLAGGVGLFVGALVDEDALGRAFLFADETGDAAQAGHRVCAVVYEEREIPRRFDSRGSFFRELNCGQPLLADVAAEKVTTCLGESLQNA